LILLTTSPRWAKESEPGLARRCCRRLTADFETGAIGYRSAAEALWQQRYLDQKRVRAIRSSNCVNRQIPDKNVKRQAF